MSRYEDGTAVYDVIRDALRDGQPRTVLEISQITGYSESYVRRWLNRMSDVIYTGSATRAYRYRLTP